MQQCNWIPKKIWGSKASSLPSSGRARTTTGSWSTKGLLGSAFQQVQLFNHRSMSKIQIAVYDIHNNYTHVYIYMVYNVWYHKYIVTHNNECIYIYNICNTVQMYVTWLCVYILILYDDMYIYVSRYWIILVYIYIDTIYCDIMSYISLRISLDHLPVAWTPIWSRPHLFRWLFLEAFGSAGIGAWVGGWT